ncbi:MAG: hypothetical protein LBD31_09885 [Treponema sp.]|jgi:hypothetical protein|nr:hypothetical protein [Treponema sp.]
MKKGLVFLLFLLAAGGAVFFLGWTQSGVPPGSWGVLRSKTHGTDPLVIREGKPRWIWYKLIPGNVQIAVFTLKDVSVPVEVSGVLPSGEVYSAMAGLKTGFPYHLSASVSFRIRGESLPDLAEQENLLNQEDLDRYLTRLSGEIETLTRGLLWTYGENENVLREARKTGTIQTLETALRSAFPHTENLNCTAGILRFPDFLLYEEVRGLYRDYLAAQRSQVREQINLMAVENTRNRRRFEELTSYGELLTKYPLLLQYLALEKGLPPGSGKE